MFARQLSDDGSVVGARDSPNCQRLSGMGDLAGLDERQSKREVPRGCEPRSTATRLVEVGHGRIKEALEVTSFLSIETGVNCSGALLATAVERKKIRWSALYHFSAQVASTEVRADFRRSSTPATARPQR